MQDNNSTVQKHETTASHFKDFGGDWCVLTKNAGSVGYTKAYPKSKGGIDNYLL